MKHEVSFDRDTRIVTIKVMGSYTLEESIETEKYMLEITKDFESYHLLADMREANSKLDKDVRKHLQEQMSGDNMKKVAMVVTNPAVRMMGKVVIATMGKSENTRFFKTTDEALDWLKQAD